MSIPPSHTLQSVILPDTYRLALRWWLGVPLLNTDEPRSCHGCGHSVDIFGTICSTVRAIISLVVTQQCRNAFSILLACGHGVDKEQAVPSAGQNLRPADLLLRHWEGGRHLAVDITVSHGWQRSEQSATRERWRKFLTAQEHQKHAQYDALCAVAGRGFKAMAFGTWGGKGPDCAKLLDRVAKRSAGWHEGHIREHRQEECRQQVGLTLMRAVWEDLLKKNFL